MIWYVRKENLGQLEHIPKGDKRELISKLQELLENESAFTLHGFEHILTPRLLKVLGRLVEKEIFVPISVSD